MKLDSGVHYGNNLAASFGTKFDVARCESEQRVIVTASDIGAGVEVGTTLANNNFAGFDNLTTEALDAEVLSIGVATISGRGRALFMCREFPTSW